VIEEILPPQAVAVDTREDMLEVEFFPEELALLGRVVEKRRREFTTVRACARRALAGLGLPPAPITTGERGQPLWPTGVVGSITHCASYRACVLAHVDDLVGLGIDAEPHMPLPEGVITRIARLEELQALSALARANPEVHWDRLLFCAKESVYKVWFPLTHRWLGFEDVVLTFNPRADTFVARLLRPWPESAIGGCFPPIIEGRWLVHEGLVLVAIALSYVADRKVVT
jgi:4'-phosphopantetheinyl transferase EntD